MKKAGRVLKFYSSIITQGIPLFMAVGLLTALASVTGWLHNSPFKELPDVVTAMVIPVWLGYTAGKKCGGASGGIAGTLAASVIISTKTPAMTVCIVAGCSAGYGYKKLIERSEDKMPAGFEMLFRNTGQIAVGLLCGFAACKLVLPVTGYLGERVSVGLSRLIDAGLFPLAGLIVEPLKIVFLNNWLNHGFLLPLGLKEAEAAGHSILFLLETNPGPGFGILAAYGIIFHRERRKTLSDLLIQLVGGIHEIYFPYVLSDLKLLIAAIAGNIAGNYVFLLFGSGLTGPASPGSIITILALSDKKSWFGAALGLAVSAAVSCIFSCVILARGKRKKNYFTNVKPLEDDMNQNQKKTRAVYFVCDAGMGSSAMASALFRRRLKAESIEDVMVSHAAADSIPADADAVICQKDFASCLPPQSARIFLMESLTDMEGCGEILTWLKGGV